MRIAKTIAKTTTRKAVKKAIAKQDAEQSQMSASVLWNSEQIQDAVRLKAYELYVQGGCQPGNDVQNWLAAEQLINREQS